MSFMGAVAAAEQAQLVREFVDHLREHKSFSRATATLLRPQHAVGRRALLSMVADGSIVSAGEDLYWLDEAAYVVATRKRRRDRLVWVLLAAAILVVGAIALAGSLWRGGQG